MEISGNKEIGQIIRDGRKKKGLTQKSFGDTIGKSKRTIQHYEAGTTAIPIDTLLVIADVLGISKAKLLPDYWEALEDSINFLKTVLQREPLYEEVAAEVELPIAVVEALMQENETKKNNRVLKEGKEEPTISASDLADFLKVTLKQDGIEQVIHIMKDNSPVFCLFLNTGNVYIVSYKQALEFWQQSRSFGIAFLQEIETHCQKATLSF